MEPEKGLEIKYPCKWNYKIIGEDVNKMIEEVEMVFPTGVDIQASNISKKGKYKSLNISIVINSETERNIYFEKLSSSKHIKFVL